MAHVLVVESWVGAMSRLLPRAVGELGHTFTFLTRDLSHYLRSAPEGTGHPLLGATHILGAETNDLEGILRFAERAHEAFAFDGVLSACDYYLETSAHIAARLGLAGPKPESVRHLRRKHLLRRAMSEAGLASPAFAVTETWEQADAAALAIGYPLVVKPVDLCAGMLVRLVRGPEELAGAWSAVGASCRNARQQERVGLVLVEEFLVGAEVSVETVTFDGRTTVIGVTDKSVAGEPWFVETGHMFPALLDDAELRAAVALAVGTLSALGLDYGVCHTEIKLTADGPRVVEVNPRPAGNWITELVRRVRGVDLTAALVELSLGIEPDLSPRATGVSSAAIAFVLPTISGRLRGLSGGDRLREAADVAQWELANDPGASVARATNNNDYLGHVMVVDTAGGGARRRAEELVAAVEVLVDPDAGPA